MLHICNEITENIEILKQFFRSLSGLEHTHLDFFEKASLEGMSQTQYTTKVGAVIDGKINSATTDLCEESRNYRKHS